MLKIKLKSQNNFLLIDRHNLYVDIYYSRSFLYADAKHKPAF